MIMMTMMMYVILGEYEDNNDNPNDETNPRQKRKCKSPVKESKKRKTGESSMPLQEHEERVETIVDVPCEHEIEEIPQEGITSFS